jgi:hypothetical protein
MVPRCDLARCAHVLLLPVAKSTHQADDEASAGGWRHRPRTAMASRKGASESCMMPENG